MTEPLIEPTNKVTPEAAAKAPAKAAAPVAPPRPLPTLEDISAWVHGADVPLVGALFEGLNVTRFDTLVMQVRKEELVPQHWQVITDHTPPDDLEFNRLAEIGKLRVRYKDQELARRRIEQLLLGWRELGGRRPALWSVPDLLAAMRRLIDKARPVQWHEFLSAVRDVWRDHELPFGKEQLEIWWACLALIRKNTKK
ncbi:MAG TPA: hypothetical protein VGK45_03675 [Thermoanaerobaculia bacterium]